MLLERVELRYIRMPLISPFETSGWVETERGCLIVSVLGGGVVGWGECVAMDAPWYSYETVETAWHILRDYLIPLVVGQEIRHADELSVRFSRIRGHPMAKAGLEMAIWDWLAKAENISLAQALGGVRERVPVGVSVGIQPSLPNLVEAVSRYLDEGYQRIKIKIKPGWDVAAVQALRREFNEIRLQVDANSAYTLDDLPTFQALDEYDLILIEQPLGADDIYDHAQLQRYLLTPLCLDESIHSPDDARLALSLGSCRVINIKPGRVGGLSASRQIHDLCATHNIPVWCGGMLETGIGRAANVALASMPNFRLPGDISASARYYSEEVINPSFILNPDSTLSVPRNPGIGVEVIERQLDRFTLRRMVFPA